MANVPFLYSANKEYIKQLIVDNLGYLYDDDDLNKFYIFLTYKANSEGNVFNFIDRNKTKTDSNKTKAFIIKCIKAFK